MNKFTHLLQFVQYLFDEKETAKKAKPIIEGISKARSPLLSNIAREMAGKENRLCGTLSDGETRDYWLLFLSTAFHGRSIPCGFVSCSSKTINQEATSRNYHPFETFAKVQEMIGDRPLVLDREFSSGIDRKSGL